MLKDTRYIRAYPKVGPENRDFWCDARSETQDQSHRWDPGPEARDSKGRTRDPRLGTQLIGGTRDPRPGTLKVNV